MLIGSMCFGFGVAEGFVLLEVSSLLTVSSRVVDGGVESFVWVLPRRFCFVGTRKTALLRSPCIGSRVGANS